MKDFFQQVNVSAQLPKKKAVFQLNRMRIGVPFFYIGILLIFICIPLLVQSFSNREGALGDLALPIYLVYFVFVFFPIFSGAVYLLIASISAIALSVARLLDRKLTFLMMFKLASFAATFPLIGYGILLVLNESLATLWIWPSVVFIFFIVCRSIFLLSKAKKRMRRVE